MLLKEVSDAFRAATKAAKAPVEAAETNETSPMKGTREISWGKACKIVCTINVSGLFITGYDIVVTANDGTTKRTFEDLFVHVPLSEEERSSLLHLIYWAYTWIQTKPKRKAKLKAPAGADTP